MIPMSLNPNNPFSVLVLFNWSTASDTVYPAFLRKTWNLAFKLYSLGFHLSLLASACCLSGISRLFLSISLITFHLYLPCFFGNSSCLMVLSSVCWQLLNLWLSSRPVPCIQTHIYNCVFDISTWLPNSRLRLYLKLNSWSSLMP